MVECQLQVVAHFSAGPSEVLTFEHDMRLKGKQWVVSSQSVVVPHSHFVKLWVTPAASGQITASGPERAEVLSSEKHNGSIYVACKCKN